MQANSRCSVGLLNNLSTMSPPDFTLALWPIINLIILGLVASLSGVFSSRLLVLGSQLASDNRYCASVCLLC